MQLLCLDVYKNEIRLCDCNGLEDFYEQLDCSTIDIVRRKIGDKVYDIICDDEGLFRDDARVSAITEDGEPALVGNLLFSNHSGAETTALTPNDITNIANHILYLPDFGHFAVFCAGWAVQDVAF